jgi:C1A family cysteine protease
MTIELEQFGYRPDPVKQAGEKPDFNFKSDLAPKLVLVASGDVDLRPHCTETHQLNASSCVGNATADSEEILNSIEGRPQVQLSRLFIYTLARNLMDVDGDGKGDIDKDKGTYIRLAFDVLSKFGVCTEKAWPYDLSKKSILPSLKAMREATGHRIHSYYRVTGTGDDRCDEVLQALRSNHPVVFGTLINNEFLRHEGEGPVGIPEGDTIGGHAMIVVGYLTGKGFLVKNSWGRGWGDGGYWIMKPEYLGWSNTTDLWVPTKGTSFK